VGGAGAAGATGAPDYAIYPIPSSTARVAGPPPPADYDQTDYNELTPQEAPIGQLFAITDSELRRADGGAASWNPAIMTDFADAITTRCSPQLDAADVGTLNDAKARYSTLPSDED
jgi:hypothetical protein